MAWPVTARYQTFVDATTRIVAAFLHAMQDALIGLYSGTKSVKALAVDGVGNQTVALTAGMLDAVAIHSQSTIAAGGLISSLGSLEAGIGITADTGNITATLGNIVAAAGSMTAQTGILCAAGSIEAQGDPTSNQGTVLAVHYKGTGGAPTKSNEGTGVAATVAAGSTDARGSVRLTLTGATGDLVRINYAKAYATAPIVVMGYGLSGNQFYINNATSTATYFVISTDSTITGSATLNYIVMG